MAPTRGISQRETLVAELARLRAAGLTRLRSLDLPALRAIASFVLGSDEPAAVEQLLRQALVGLGGGEFGEAAALLFGLARGFRGRRPADLRRLAAEIFGIQADTFRKSRERLLIEQMADQLIGLETLRRVTPTRPHETPAERQARLERLASEIAELPAAELGLLVPLLHKRLNYQG